MNHRTPPAWVEGCVRGCSGGFVWSNAGVVDARVLPGAFPFSVAKVRPLTAGQPLQRCIVELLLRDLGLGPRQKRCQKKGGHWMASLSLILPCEFLPHPHFLTSFPLLCPLLSLLSSPLPSPLSPCCPQLVFFSLLALCLSLSLSPPRFLLSLFSLGISLIFSVCLSLSLFVSPFFPLPSLSCLQHFFLFLYSFSYFSFCLSLIFCLADFLILLSLLLPPTISTSPTSHCPIPHFPFPRLTQLHSSFLTGRKEETP